MICSHIVNLSLLLGAVLSWGIMWPLISDLKEDWFSGSIPKSSMRSLQGYKVHHIKFFAFTMYKNLCAVSAHIYICSFFQVFISIALILGDGLYNFLKILACTAKSMHTRATSKNIKIGIVADEFGLTGSSLYLAAQLFCILLQWRIRLIRSSTISSVMKYS